MKIIHKIFSTLLFIMFVYFASLQFNDPDPQIWVTIYGAAALLHILSVFNIYNKYVTLAVMIILGIYDLFYIPGVVEWLQQPDKGDVFGMMRVDRIWIEESREFLGLVIAIGSLYYLRRAHR